MSIPKSFSIDNFFLFNYFLNQLRNEYKKNDKKCIKEHLNNLSNYVKSFIGRIIRHALSINIRGLFPVMLLPKHMPLMIPPLLFIRQFQSVSC